jgi:flagellar motor switch/type III secretory pathway protein FliN
MATAQSTSTGVAGPSGSGDSGFPVQGQVSGLGPSASGAAHGSAATAMVPSEAVPSEGSFPDIGQEPQPFSPTVMRLPVELDVMVPVRNFRVRNLLTLEPGRVIESQWGHGEDVPVAAGEIPLAWSEFEVIETQLAVRITRLA